MKSAFRRMKISGFHFTLGISRGFHLNEVKISSKLAWISSALADFIINLVINWCLSVRMHSAIASLREGGGPLAVEGERETMGQNLFHCNAFSLSRLRRQLPPGGSLASHICAVKLPDKSKFKTNFLRPSCMPELSRILREFRERACFPQADRRRRRGWPRGQTPCASTTSSQADSLLLLIWI